MWKDVVHIIDHKNEAKFWGRGTLLMSRSIIIIFYWNSCKLQSCQNTWFWVSNDISLQPITLQKFNFKCISQTRSITFVSSCLILGRIPGPEWAVDIEPMQMYPCSLSDDYNIQQMDCSTGNKKSLQITLSILKQASVLCSKILLSLSLRLNTQSYHFGFCKWMIINEKFTVVLVFTSLKSVQHKSLSHVVPNCIFTHNDINFVLAVDPAVFISYWGKEKENQKTVKHLCSKLTEAGFHCWLDIEQMGGGGNWNVKIYEGIRAAKVTKFRIFKHRCYRLKARKNSILVPVSFP